MKKINLNLIFYRFKPISLAEKMLFTKNLGVLASSGIALPRCFALLANQTKNPYFKSAILNIEQEIRKGTNLADSLSKHPKIFNQFYVNMIKVGELGGNLEDVLKTLAKQIKKDHKLITKVKSAMIYPVLILFVLISIAIGMLIFVVPKLMQIFENMQAELPWNTKIFLNLAENTRLYGGYLLIVIIILFAAAYFFRRKQAGRQFFDNLILKMPFIGKISKKINTARFASNLSSLLNSGISLTDSLITIKGVLKNKIYSLSIQDIVEKIKKGESLDNALLNYPEIYPALLIQMVEIGEETGAVSEQLSKLADFYQDEIDETMKNISSIIEPVLMIIIGGAVGFFALSMISPIYSIMQNI